MAIIPGGLEIELTIWREIDLRSAASFHSFVPHTDATGGAEKQMSKSGVDVTPMTMAEVGDLEPASLPIDFPRLVLYRRFRWAFLEINYTKNHQAMPESFHSIHFFFAVIVLFLNAMCSAPFLVPVSVDVGSARRQQTTSTSFRSAWC